MVRGLGRQRLRGLLISFGLSLMLLPLIYFTSGIRLDRMVNEWHGADGSLLLIAMVFSVLVHVLVGGHKLWLILRGMGLEISLVQAFKLRLGEGPLRLIIPLKGGELVAVFFLNRVKAMPLGDAAGALVFDRGLNLMGSCFWLGLGISLAPGLGSVRGIAAVAGLLSAGLIFLLFSPLHDLLIRLAGSVSLGRVGRFFAGMLSPWRDLTVARKLLLFAYTLLFVSRPIVICSLILASFQISLGTARLLVYTTLSLFAGMIPGPLMGIGPREAAMQALVGQELPHGSGAALSVGFLLTVCMYLVPFLAGLPWVPWFLGRIAAARKE